MKKIVVTTTKKVVCEIRYAESTLCPDQIKEFVKKQNLIPEYDEIHTDMVNSVILFIKYTHNFTVKV